jgi:thiol:disulfide interchange protein
MSDENIDSNENQIKQGPKKLSMKKKILLALIFVIGLPLSYPTIFPLGLICSSILLFQKNKKVLFAAFFLIFVQIVLLVYFGFFYAKIPHPPY